VPSGLPSQFQAVRKHATRRCYWQFSSSFGKAYSVKAAIRLLSGQRTGGANQLHGPAPAAAIVASALPKRRRRYETSQSQTRVAKSPAPKKQRTLARAPPATHTRESRSPRLAKATRLRPAEAACEVSPPKVAPPLGEIRLCRCWTTGIEPQGKPRCKYLATCPDPDDPDGPSLYCDECAPCDLSPCVCNCTCSGCSERDDVDGIARLDAETPLMFINHCSDTDCVLPFGHSGPHEMADGSMRMW